MRSASLMRMPRQALHHLVVMRGQLQAAAGGKLADGAAVDLLPGSLVLQLGRRVHLQARGDLRLAEKQVDAPGVKVAANADAGLDERKTRHTRRFRRGMATSGDTTRPAPATAPRSRQTEHAA